MNKAAWLKHIDSVMPEGMLRPSQGGDPSAFREFIAMHKPGCSQCAERAKTRKANANAKIKRAVYESLGMKRVRGALGGTYYE